MTIDDGTLVGLAEDVHFPAGDQHAPGFGGGKIALGR